MSIETEKLRSALRMCAAALQAACQPGRPLRESDTITDGGGSRMTLANILDAADDALGGSFAEQPAAQEAASDAMEWGDYAVPDGFEVEESFGGWQYTYTADGAERASSATWNNPLHAAIAAWEHAAQRPWLPIETAPRDGTRVLLVTALGSQFVGKYADAKSRFPWHHEYTATYLAEAKLSGWMPLPAAPEVRND